MGTTVEFPRADGSNDICTSQEGLHLQQALRNEIISGGGSGHGVFLRGVYEPCVVWFGMDV